MASIYALGPHSRSLRIWSYPSLFSSLPSWSWQVHALSPYRQADSIWLLSLEYQADRGDRTQAKISQKHSPPSAHLRTQSSDLVRDAR